MKLTRFFRDAGWRWLMPLALVALLVTLLAACQSASAPGAEGLPSSAPDRNENTLVFAYDGWRGTWLPTAVLRVILEDQLGYQVVVTNQETVPGAFESVARGETDIFTSGWFPARDFTFGKYPDLVKLGQVYGGGAKDASEGWMLTRDVAQRFNVVGLADLRDPSLARALDTDGDGLGNITGCPADWACAGRHPEMLRDFGLARLYEIDEQSSEDAMRSAIASRLRSGQPALFYMLHPGGLPSDLQVTNRAVWLAGTESYLPLSFNRNIVANQFLAAHPDVAVVLTRYRIPGTDIASAMNVIADEGDPEETADRLAREWIAAHQAQVDSWLAGVTKRPAEPAGQELVLGYSPEKEDLFLKLVAGFNLARPPEVWPVRPVRIDMEDMLQEAVDGRVQAISPDSSVWLEQINRRWQQVNPGAAPLIGDSARYALSPIVIAMWESRAAELGYPEEPLGWQDLIDKVAEDPTFKWSHPSATTASGLLATTAEFYAGAGKDSGLTAADLTDQETLDFVTGVEATVERYGGESEDKVVVRMLAEGGTPLDALVAQEQLVVYFNRNTSGEQLVAVYPEEGTFWMDHPLVLLDGPWVQEPQRRAFREFSAFVRAPEQQRLVMSEGYRPGDLGASLNAAESLIKPEYHVDPAQPTVRLQVPPAGVLEGIREVWRLTKRPANIYLVVDVSGSMSGEPLDSAKDALRSFVDQVQGDRDQLALIAFSDQVQAVERLGPLDQLRRDAFRGSINGLDARGGTLLYDAVAYAFDRLQEEADAERINVIVAMTDGRSQGELGVLETAIGRAKVPVLIFTVGYGEEADIDVLERIARLGDGQAYPSDPGTIESLYRLLSDFF